MFLTLVAAVTARPLPVPALELRRHEVEPAVDNVVLDRPHLAPPAAAKVGAAVVDQADQGAAAERRQGGEVAIAGGGLPDGAGEGAGREDLPGGRVGDRQDRQSDVEVTGVSVRVYIVGC